MITSWADGTGSSMKEDSAVEILVERVKHFMSKCSVVMLKKRLPGTFESVAVIEDPAVKIGLGRAPGRVFDLFRSCQFPSAHPLRIEESSQEFLRGTHCSMDHWWTNGI